MGAEYVTNQDHDFLDTGDQLTRKQRDYIESLHRRGNREVLPGRYEESPDRPEVRDDHWASLPRTEPTKRAR